MQKNVVIIGSQWGDEGKGKITDKLGQKCDLVVRFQGGNNAGHTIVVGDQKTVLHLIPSGILHPTCLSLIGHGVVFDPLSFQKELEDLRSSNIFPTPNQLKISPNCPVITTYHKILDHCREEFKKGEKIGTTGKGIGPAYEDKISRKSIKLGDLQNIDVLRKKLKEVLQEKEVLFRHHFKAEYPAMEEELGQLYELGKLITPFLADTFKEIDKAQSEGKKILFEGAQGVLLDIDYGSYPYVTSSNTSVGGVFTGAGLPKGNISETLGITKAYTTRVGSGPFPTELFDEVGERIQKKGNEFGATTGRRRRCGWLDLPLLKYSVKSSRITSLALTKVDVLSGMDNLKVCYGYEVDGKVIDCAYPGLDLESVKPLYKDLKGLPENVSNGEMGTELKEFIKEIEEFVKVPVGVYAYGPERDQTIFLQEYF